MPSLAEPLPQPPRLSRRRADGEGGRTTRDRLTTMLVLAALLHGLVILGVSFTAPGDTGDKVDRGMEVLLVSDELPESLRNESATYLAQRTQTGSGNTRERVTAKLPTARRGADPAAGAPAQQADLREEVLTTSAASPTRIQMLPLPATAEQAEEQEEELQRAGDRELRLRGETRDELYVTADTRASRLAPYLDGWRRRVERVGTINYPSVAQRRGMTGNPVIEVVIQRDGKLQSARIQRTSGHPEIDAAALDILRLASPFDALPPDLARDYRTLRFAYQWQFEEGSPSSSAIRVP
jgi:periplasmic protein TonB